MSLRRLIRKTILRWERWRFERRFPELALVNQKIAMARQKHRAIRHLERARSDLIHARMRLETNK